MDRADDMHLVLASLRRTRALAVNTLKREYPDLYVLSAQAFETGVPGSIGQRQAGRVPDGVEQCAGDITCRGLAIGRHADVHRQLADRAGIDSGE